MNITEALQKIEDAIVFGDPMPNRSEAQEAETFARRMMTGKDHEEILKEIKKRMTASQTADLADIYRPVTTYILAPHLGQANKIFRTDNITAELIGNPDDINAVRLAVKDFQPGMTVDAWLQPQLLQANFYKPNSWIIIEQMQERNQDGTVASINCYPIILNFENIHDWGTDRRGRTEWLIASFPRMEVSANRETKHSVNDWYLYAAGITVVYREWVDQMPDVPLANSVDDVVLHNGSRAMKFQSEVYLTGSKEFPGMQIGATPDPMYGSRVQRPFYHMSEPVLKDSIVHKAEADIAEVKHLFPKRWQFAPECEFQNDSGDYCDNGHLQSGKVCPACQGRGVKVHGSGMDVIFLPYPKTVDEAQTRPKLSELSYYEDIPVDTAKYYSEAWERDSVRVGIAMHGTMTKDGAPSPLQIKTATEVLEDSEAKNTNHLRLADRYSQLWMLIHRLAANYLNVNVEPRHEFRRDLKMDSIDEMIARVKNAKEAGLPFEMVFSEQCSILAKQGGSDAGYVESIKAKVEYTPFSSLSEPTIIGILGTRAQDDYDRVFYENKDTVWRLVDERMGEEKFYLLAPETKKRILSEVVAEVSKTIKWADDGGQPFGVDSIGMETDPIDAAQ